MVAKSSGVPEPHRADKIGFLYPGQEIVIEGEDPPRIVEQHLAGRRQPHQPRIAFEQRPPHRLLPQPLHLQRDCRLGPQQPLGRPGEASRIGDDHECAQQVRVETLHSRVIGKR